LGLLLNGARARLLRGGLLLETLLAWLVALPVLALAWQTPGPLAVDIGPPDAIYLTGWDVPEVRDGHNYRWSIGPASLHLPGVGVRSWRVTLVAAAGRRPAGAPPLIVRAGSEIVFQTPAADAGFRAYTFDVPARAVPAGDLDLDFEIPPFRPPDENRTLGLALDRVTVESSAPRFPAPVAWAAFAAALALVYATSRLIWSWRGAVAAGCAATLVLAGLLAGWRLLLTPYASYLPMIAGLLFVGLYVLRGTLRRYAPESAMPTGSALGGERIMVALTLAVVLGYGLLAFGAQIVFLARKPLPDDFVVFYRAAGRLLAHQPLYDAAGLGRNPLDAYYKYPPLFALLLAPLTGLTMRAALQVWNLANLLFLGGGLLAVLRAHDRRLGAGAPAAVLLVTLALVFQPVVDTLIAGQMDLAIFGLLAFTYWALRTGRPGWAGALLAVAVLFKLYPAVLLVFLLLRRERRALAAFAGTTVALVAGSLAFTGVAPWWDFLTVALPHNGGPTAWVENQTFAGFLARLLTDNSVPAPFPAAPPGPALALTIGTAVWALGLPAATIWTARRPVGRRDPGYALGFALFAAVTVMALPNAWFHYMTLLLLPLGIGLLVAEEAAGRWWAAWPRPVTAALALLGLAAVVLAVGSYPLVWGGYNLGGPWKLILSYKFYAACALWLSLWWMLRVSYEPSTVSRQESGALAVPGFVTVARPVAEVAAAPEAAPAPARLPGP
jgi:hypothetical protein